MVPLATLTIERKYDRYCCLDGIGNAIDPERLVLPLPYGIDRGIIELGSRRSAQIGFPNVAIRIDACLDHRRALDSRKFQIRGIVGCNLMYQL